jgi:Ricin-type beta-trefoil lectin domain-like
LKKVMFAVPVLALAAAVAGPLASAHAADSDSPWSHISSVAAPQQVLDGTNGQHGARVDTYQVHPANTSNQLWRLENRPGGTVALVNKQQGMCLTSTGAHSQTLLSACDFFAANQRFFQNTFAGNLRQFESAQFEGTCLTLDDRNAPAAFHACNQSPDQVWKLSD